MWQPLLQTLANKGVLLTPEETTLLQAAFGHRKYRKNQYILQEGDVCRYDSYIVKGLVRVYEVDDKGQEHILYFGPEDWWVGDLYSFHSGKPTNRNVDCLEDTEVLQITKGDLNRLFESVPKLNVYFRILYQNAIVAYNRRVGSNLSKSALERYEDFMQRYPQIQQRVPNHQIAAFLGITPQSLSRLRSRASTHK